MMPKTMAARVARARTAAPNRTRRLSLIGALTDYPCKVLPKDLSCNPASKLYKCSQINNHMNFNRIDTDRTREGGTELPALHFMEGAFLFLIGPAQLKLEAHPTPERSQNRNEHHARILPVHCHISLVQKIAEIGQRFPAPVESRQRLANRKVQVWIHLVGRLAKLVHARQRGAGNPFVAR